MKITYETFTEIANDIVDGNKFAHAMSDHNQGVCLIWQKAIQEFASALDLGGYKPNGEADKMWGNLEKAFTEWTNGYGKQEPRITREELVEVEITEEQAKELLGKGNYTKGMKVFEPYRNTGFWGNNLSSGITKYYKIT